MVTKKAWLPGCFFSVLLYSHSPVRAFSLASLFPPTVPLLDGVQGLSLYGTGPPRRLQLRPLWPHATPTVHRALRRHAPSVTLVVLNDPVPLTAAVVNDIADSLAVDAVGFFAHSSIDSSILCSTRINSAVLCDPVALPRVSLGLGRPPVIEPVLIDRPIPFLILRSSKAYGDSDVPIPEYLVPDLPSGCVDEEVFPDVGHADLLDDTWAAVGPRVLPWMRGAVRQPQPFSEWSHHTGGPAKIRAEYREAVAARAVAHILRGRPLSAVVRE